MLPHEFWQQVYPPASFQLEGRHNDRFPATLRDGRQILLPIRPLPDGKRALASLIINQASFAVQDAIAEGLAAELSPLGPALIVGLPTLGLTVASAVARKLGHARYIPLGTSRKFWYDDDLSVPLSSITSPSHSKRLYVDPRMLPLLENSRVALVDDVTSSGVSMAAGIALLAACGVRAGRPRRGDAADRAMEKSADRGRRALARANESGLQNAHTGASVRCNLGSEQ